MVFVNIVGKDLGKVTDWDFLFLRLHSEGGPSETRGECIHGYLETRIPKVW